MPPGPPYYLQVKGVGRAEIWSKSTLENFEKIVTVSGTTFNDIDRAKFIKDEEEELLLKKYLGEVITRSQRVYEMMMTLVSKRLEKERMNEGAISRQYDK